MTDRQALPTLAEGTDAAQPRENLRSYLPLIAAVLLLVELNAMSIQCEVLRSSKTPDRIVHRHRQAVAS